MATPARTRLFFKSLMLAFLACLGTGVATAAGNVHDIIGSGVIEAQNRDTGHYDKVVIDLPYVVELQFGKSEMVTVTTDENLQALISTTVNDHVLRIALSDPNNCIRATKLKIEMPAKKMDDMSVSAGTEIHASEINTSRLTFSEPKKTAVACHHQ
jgi:hypothetical protein